MRDLIINGVPLRDPQKMWFIDYRRSSLFSQISRRFLSEDSIGYHGVDWSGPAFFSSAQDSIVLNLQAPNKDSWNTAFRAISAIFMQESLQLVSAPQRTPLVAGSGRINRTFDASPDVLQVATGRTLGTIAVERINERAARLTILIERPDSFWQSPGQIESAAVPLAGTNTTIELTGMFDSTGPITDGLIRIKGPLANGVSVEIRDRGRVDNALKFTVPSSPSPSYASGDYLLLDIRTLMAKKMTTNNWNIDAGVIDARGSISISSQGGFALTPETPGPGFPDIPNRYYIEVVRDGTDITSEVQTRLKRSYLS